MATRRVWTTAFVTLTVVVTGLWLRNMQQGVTPTPVASRDWGVSRTLSNGLVANDGVPLGDELSRVPPGIRSVDSQVQVGEIVRGQVLTPQGNPLMGVDVSLVVRPTVSVSWWNEVEPFGVAFEGTLRRANILTDKDGRFEFLGVPAGQTSLRVDAPGYVSLEREIDPRGMPTNGLTIVLEVSSQLSVKVASADGSGVGGVRIVAVELFMFDLPERLLLDRLRRAFLPSLISPRSVRSDAFGRAELRSLRSLPYSLLVFSPEGLLIGRFEPVAPEVDVSIELPVLHEFDGVVVDASGNPVVHGVVSVRAGGEPKSGLTRRARTILGEATPTCEIGGEGGFKFANLPGESLELLVSAPGFLQRVVQVQVPIDRGIRIDLSKSRLIEGTVKNEDGLPIVNAAVWLVPEAQAIEVVEKPRRGPSNTARYSVRTGPMGEFAFHHVEPDIYYIESCANDYVGTGLLEVANGEAMQHLVLNEGVPIYGAVRSAATNSLIPGVRVHAEGCSTVTDENGQYALSGIVPRDFEGSVLYVQIFFDHPQFSPRWIAQVPVSQGFPEELDVTLNPWRKHAGRVLDRQGEPVSGARVELVDSEAKNRLRPARGFGSRGIPVTYTDTSGYFSILWRQAEHGLWISHPSHALLAVAEIRSTLEGERVEHVLEDGLALRGICFDSRSNPLAGSTVTVTARPSGDAFTSLSEVEKLVARESSVWEQTVTADVQGRFSFENVLQFTSTTDFTVTARKLDFASSRLPVRVEGGETEIETKLVLLRSRVLSGVVLGDDGPIAGASIEVFRDSPVTPIGGDAPLVEVKSSLDGRFDLVDLPMASVRIEARAEGYETTVLPRLHPTDRQDGEIIVVNLQPLPSVRLAVIEKETRSPVTKYYVSVQGLGEVQESTHLLGTHEIEDAEGRGTVVVPNASVGYRFTVFSDSLSPQTMDLKLSRGEIRSVGVSLDQGRTLEVRVYDEGEAAASLPEATVRLFDQGGRPLPGGSVSAQTDSRGRATIQNVARGTYQLRVEHAEFATFVTPIRIDEAGGGLERVEVPLTRSGRVRLRFYSKGREERAVSVMLQRVVETPSDVSETASSTEISPEPVPCVLESGVGEIQVGSLAPGLYRVVLLGSPPRKLGVVRIESGRGVVTDEFQLPQ